MAVNPKNDLIYVSSPEYDKVSLYKVTDFKQGDITYQVKSIQTGNIHMPLK